MKKRLFSVVVSIVMICSIIIVSTTDSYAYGKTAAATNDYTTWKQTSVTWGEATPWPNASIPKFGDAGCWITSVAILLRHYNVVTESDVNKFNPLICNNRLMEYGVVNSAGDYANLANMKKAYPGFEYVGKKTYSHATLKSLYDQGYACIVHETKGHYVAVRTVSASGAVVMDPGSSLTTLTNSDYIQYFKVTVATPQPAITTSPTISSSKITYDIGETVTLKRNTVANTNFYQLIVWKDAKQILSTKMSNSTYTLNNLSKGTYYAYLQVGNSTSGTITSKKYVFTVGHPMTFKLQGGSVGKSTANYKVTGFNTGRPNGALIVYNNAGTQPGTNQYGMEAAVDSTGKVTAIRAYNSTTQLTVPKGGFIVSGHLDSTSSTSKGGFLFVNTLEVGDYVYCDYPNKKVYKYETRDAYLANHMLVDVGSKYGTLPTPTREGYVFDGWFTGANSGTKVTSNTTVAKTTLYAHWLKKPTGQPITFDLQGGTVGNAIATYNISAVNATRLVGALNIYNVAGAISGTTTYGREAAVDSTGKVIAIREPDSTTQLTVPEGGFVVSGRLNSDAAEGKSGYYFVKALEIGDYVYADCINKKVYAYETRDAYLANHKRVNSGSKYGTLPTPTREGYTFDGWYTTTTGGTKVTSSSTLSKTTLYAQWTKEDPCSLGHSWNSGTVTKAATCTATGIKTFTCTTCKTTKTETIAALGHSYNTNWTTDKAATCTAEGSKSQHCTRSGCTAKANVTAIAKTAHKYDAGKITTVATASKPGVKTYTCTVCKATKTESVPYSGTTTSSKDIERIWGKSRYKTSLAIADELKAELGVSQFRTVIIASGTNFPDALAGSYLATKTNAPILMVRDNADDISLVQNYITKNLKSSGKVYILGGSAAVPESIEKNLKAKGYDVERLKGKNRYDTNLAILKEAGVNNEDILVCTGTNFADSLSASATGLPILLVDPNTQKLSNAQINFLDNRKCNFYIIGGTGAVSDTYLNAVKKYDADNSVKRVKGKSRYETSVEVAKTFCGNADKAVIASATNFPDGLCGGPLAFFMDAPLILTGSNTSPATTYISSEGISEGKVLGGEGAVKETVARTVFGMGSNDKISGTRYN